jgi:hypothetical protein
MVGLAMAGVTSSRAVANRLYFVLMAMSQKSVVPHPPAEDLTSGQRSYHQLNLLRSPPG